MTDENKKLIVKNRFLEARDFGYLEYHGELTKELYDLVGVGAFTAAASEAGVTEGWKGNAEQAAENYARHLILVSDNDPTVKEAKEKVLKEFTFLLKHRGRGDVDRGMAVH